MTVDAKNGIAVHCFIGHPLEASQATIFWEFAPAIKDVRYLATILITFLFATPILAVEPFRYRGAAKDGGTLEYVFETDRQNVPATATKEKVAEIAADFMTTYYHVQIGAMETQELRTTPVPF
jgi:hypothetical protein